MTTPAGVPNLPIGALTVDTLNSKLQDMSAGAMRSRAGDQMPSIFGSSTGGNIMNDLSPFGILTNIWAGINSLIANADPSDITGPDDLPPLFLDFIEGLPFIGQFIELLEALAGTYEGDDPTLNGVQDLLAPIRLLVDTIGQDLADWLAWLVGTLFNGSTDPLTNIFTALKGLLDESGNLTTWVSSLLTNVWEDLLVALETLFGGFDLEAFLLPLFTALKNVWDLLGDEAASVFENIFRAFNDLVDTAGTLTGWLDQIPLIGPLVSMLTGLSPADGIEMTLSTLGTWANGLLTQVSDIPAINLKGLLPSGFLSSIPVSNIAFDTPNLMSQGDFGNVGTIDAQDGWSWDSGENHTGSGGCAKVTCNGTARRLYSNQVIKVVAGDKINLSSYVKTSNDFAGSGSCVELILVPFAGTSRYPSASSPVNIYFNTRGASSSWVQATGSTGNGTAPWTVPSGVTSVRVRLSVTAAATAGSVWFDDIDLHKTGLLSGDWMNGILGTVAEDIQHTVDQILQGIKGIGTAGSGNPLTDILGGLQSIFTTLFGPFMSQLPTNIVSNPLQAAAIPGLNATKITTGAFTADFIAENAVGSYQIADDAVDTAQIAPNAVTGTEIASNAVDSSQIAPNAVGSSEIAASAVTGGASGELAQNTVTSNNVSGIDGTKISSGTVSVDRLDTTAIGATINPTSGSGAMLSRVATDPAAVTGGRNLAPNGFFNTLSVASSDIRCLTTTGATATGTRNDYAGAFQVTTTGWYLVELSYRMNVGNGAGGMNVAPVLYKGGSLAGTSVYKVGTDTQFLWLVTTQSIQRFVQNSFIVYLTANDVVRAGMDIAYAGFASPSVGGESGTGTSGVETYFSISLLNRSFA